MGTSIFQHHVVARVDGRPAQPMHSFCRPLRMSMPVVADLHAQRAVGYLPQASPEAGSALRGACAARDRRARRRRRSPASRRRSACSDARVCVHITNQQISLAQPSRRGRTSCRRRTATPERRPRGDAGPVPDGRREAADRQRSSPTKRGAGGRRRQQPRAACKPTLTRAILAGAPGRLLVELDARVWSPSVFSAFRSTWKISL